MSSMPWAKTYHLKVWIMRLTSSCLCLPWTGRPNRAQNLKISSLHRAYRILHPPPFKISDLTGPESYSFKTEICARLLFIKCCKETVHTAQQPLVLTWCYPVSLLPMQTPWPTSRRCYCCEQYKNPSPIPMEMGDAWPHQWHRGNTTEIGTSPARSLSFLFKVTFKHQLDARLNRHFESCECSSD